MTRDLDDAEFQRLVDEGLIHINENGGGYAVEDYDIEDQVRPDSAFDFSDSLELEEAILVEFEVVDGVLHQWIDGDKV